MSWRDDMHEYEQAIGADPFANDPHGLFPPAAVDRRYDLLDDEGMEDEAHLRASYSKENQRA